MEKEFNEKNALQLIEQMIGKAKEDIQDKSFFFLFWGYLVFVAALTNWFLLEFTHFTYHSLPWLVLMPLGGIVTMIVSAREKKTQPVKVKSYVNENLKFVIQAFCIAMFTVCFCMPASGQWHAFYPSIMIIYGIWLYVSGGMLQFKSLMVGGILNFLLAGATYFSSTHQLHLLSIALGVLGGYIIPGHLLKAKYNKSV